MSTLSKLLAVNVLWFEDVFAFVGIVVVLYPAKSENNLQLTARETAGF